MENILLKADKDQKKANRSFEALSFITVLFETLEI
jgi:hypothetical protein